MQRGILCGLTNEKPDFELSCPNFAQNESISGLDKISLIKIIATEKKWNFESSSQRVNRMLVFDGVTHKNYFRIKGTQNNVAFTAWDSYRKYGPTGGKGSPVVDIFIEVNCKTKLKLNLSSQNISDSDFKIPSSSEISDSSMMDQIHKVMNLLRDLMDLPCDNEVSINRYTIEYIRYNEMLIKSQVDDFVKAINIITKIKSLPDIINEG